ncbi:MAG: aminopeptidase P family protein [Chloroflexi bacterium]|nr:aminopeptidase P family protein [Chloroflexota bacterium]
MSSREISRERILDGEIFSIAEYERRIELARRALRGSGIDVALVGDPISHCYLTGTALPTIRQSEARLLIVPSRGDPLWLVQEEGAVEIVAMTDIPWRHWDGRGGSSVLEGLIANRVVAWDRSARGLIDLPGVRPSDADGLLRRLRVAKSNAEQTRLRRAGTIAARAMRRLLTRLRSGMTERQIATVGRAALAAEGSPDGACAVKWEDGAPRYPSPRALPISAGTPFSVSLVAVVGGYRALCRRAAIEGAADAEVGRIVFLADRLHRALGAGLRAGVAPAVLLGDLSVSPQLSWSEVAPLIVESLGLAFPDETLPADETLAAGSAIVLEPPFRPRWAVAADTYLISASGAESLTACPTDLHVF